MIEELSRYLEEEAGVTVVGASSHLSNRPKLRADIEAAPDFDVMVTELKAASVDVATEAAKRVGKRVVYCDNDPVVIGEDASVLASSALELARRVVSKAKAQGARAQ